MCLTLLGYTELRPEYTAACRRLVEELGLQERVTIADFVEDGTPFFDDADYLLCSSEVESMPQSILQAMASGIRVITTPVGGVGELIIDGFGGVIADGTDAGAIAAAIARALAIPGTQWSRMVRTAHETARMVCAEDVVSYQLLRLYVEAVRRHQALASAARGIAQPSPVARPATAAATGGTAAPAANSPPGDTTLRPFTRQRLLLTPDADGWAGVDLLVGGAPDGLGARLSYSVGTAANGPLREGTLPVEVRQSGGWVAVRFPAIVHSAGQTFTLSIDVETDPPGGRVGIYTQTGAPPLRRRGVWSRGGERPMGDVVHRLHYARGA